VSEKTQASRAAVTFQEHKTTRARDGVWCPSACSTLAL